MKFSSIVQKTGICPDCSVQTERPLVAGRCRNHYWANRRKVSKDKVGSSIVTMKTLPPRDVLLDMFFERQIQLMNQHPYCWECNTFIPIPFRKHACAHIFPKAQFDSVKTHPLNCLHLGAGCGCHDKTHRLDTFSKMKIWPKAVERFLIIEPLVAEHHKYIDLFKSYIQC